MLYCSLQVNIRENAISAKKKNQVTLLLAHNYLPGHHIFTHQRNKTEKNCAPTCLSCSPKETKRMHQGNSATIWHWWHSVLEQYEKYKEVVHLAETSQRNSLALVGRTRCPLQTVVRHPILQAWHPWLEMTKHHSLWASWEIHWPWRHLGCWKGSPQGSQASFWVAFGPMESGASA